MTPAQIEESVLQALDDGDDPTQEAYAESVAGDIQMGALIEEMCLKIIQCDSVAWRKIMAQCLFHDAGLCEALAKIACHIDAQLKPFAAARASGIDDASEHDRHLLADLQRELNQGGY